MTGNKVDDLTIFLTMVDKTKKGFTSVRGRMKAMGVAATALKASFVTLGAAIGAAFTAGAINGKRVTDELHAMAIQTDLTTREVQAMYRAIQDQDPRAEIDSITEAILTLKERATDARVAGSGSLFGLMEDYDGFELDLNLDNGRLQLAEFLEEVGEMTSANDRIFALKEVIGDGDARSFFKIVNNMEKLNELVADLRSNVNDLDGIFTEVEVLRMDNAREALSQMAVDWERFSVKAYVLFAPIIELAAKVGSLAIRALDALADGISFSTNQLKKLFGVFVDTESDLLTEGALERLANGELNPTINTGELQFHNEYGSFISGKHFREFKEKIQAEISEGLSKDPIKLEAFEVKSLREGFTERFEEAHNERDTEAEATQFRIDLRAREVESINQIGDALGAAGSMFGSFAQLAAGKSQSVFKNFQRLQVAVTLAAGITAQISALAAVDAPTLTQKFAAYFKIGALVASAVTSLRSINVGSSSTNTASSGSVPSADSGPSIGADTPQQETVRDRGRLSVTLVGNGNYTADQVEQLIDAINENDSGKQIDRNRVAS